MSVGTVFNFSDIVNDADVGYSWVNLKLERNDYIKWYRAQMKQTECGDIELQVIFGFNSPKYLQYVKNLVGKPSTQITEHTESMYEYCTNGEQRIKGSKLMQRGEFNLSRIQWLKDLEHACDLGNINDAVRHMDKTHPNTVLQSSKLLSRIFSYQPCKIKYTFHDFIVPPTPEEELASRTIVLVGGSPPEKIGYAKAHFKRPAVIRDRTDYEKISPITDGVIFLDIEMCKWNPEDVKNIVDIKMGGVQNTRFGKIHIPDGIPRFIILSREHLFWPRTLQLSDFEAINKRVIIKESCPGGLFYSPDEKFTQYMEEDPKETFIIYNVL